MNLLFDTTDRRGGSAAAQQAIADLLLQVWSAANDQEAAAAAAPADANRPTRLSIPAPASSLAELASLLLRRSGTPVRDNGAEGSEEAGGGVAPADVADETSREASPAAAASEPTLCSFIVFLEPAEGGDGLLQRARALLSSLGITGGPCQVFDWLNGFVLQTSQENAQRLRNLGTILCSLEADAATSAQTFSVDPIGPATGAEPEAINAKALSSYANATAGSGEILPWGVRAVWRGQDISLRGNVASDSYAFIIDSGVLSSTGDITLASSWHRSWISGESAFTDGLGHGTHVAGTIGALANGRGVVGVAPGAQIVSLKVFDSSGGGASYASIIDAVNYAVGVINTSGLNKSKVVINMSLGGGFSTSLDTAVRNAANQGIRFAIAAGNDGKDADGYSPAAAGDHANVFTVSAVDSAYKMPSWSNWDLVNSRDRVDDVDVAAPGVSVLSYYQNGQLAYLNGTSMATPHVAGLLLMGGVVAGDPVSAYYAGTADPFAWGVSTAAAAPMEQTLDLTLWGTSLSDTVNGGGGSDRISGVLASGTTATAMGASQIDVLTGAAGADVFLLGDSRGVFYDDLQNGNLGTADLALIKDFQAREDKLQLRQGSYLFTATPNSVDLYWDRTNNGLLNNSGSDQDELIARLEGISSLSSSDIVWV